MNMSIEYILGVIVGVVVSVGVIYLFLRILTKKNHPEIKGSKRYDERQLIAQGYAYKCAFWTIVFYETIFGCLQVYTNKIDGFSFFKSPINSFLGILLGVLVYGVVCVMKDAYMSVYDNAKTTSISLLLISGCNIIPAAMKFAKNDLVVDGVWDVNVLNLYAGIAVAVIMVVFWIKLAINKKNEASDEE